jgi:hypothetical protein
MNNLNNVKLLASAFTGRPPVDCRKEEMKEALAAAAEFISQFSDMVSAGDYDEPNEAMNLASWIQSILERN